MGKDLGFIHYSRQRFVLVNMQVKRMGRSSKLLINVWAALQYENRDQRIRH